MFDYEALTSIVEELIVFALQRPTNTSQLQRSFNRLNSLLCNSVIRIGKNGNSIIDSLNIHAL